MARWLKRFFERNDWFAGRLFDVLTWKCVRESIGFFCIYTLILYGMYKLGASFISNVGVILSIFAVGDIVLPYVREIFERDSDVKSSDYFFECFHQTEMSFTRGLDKVQIFFDNRGVPIAFAAVLIYIGGTDYFPGKPLLDNSISSPDSKVAARIS